MEVWLQRISHPIQAEFSYEEQICEIVRSPGGSLWNNDWILSKPLLTALGHDIIDRGTLAKLSVVVQPDEIDLFSYE